MTHSIVLNPEHLGRTPGEILRIEMQNAKIEPPLLALKTGFTAPFIWLLLADKRPIKSLTAIRLTEAIPFGPLPEQWLAYQARFDLLRDRTVTSMVAGGTDEAQAKGWFQTKRRQLAAATS